MGIFFSVAGFFHQYYMTEMAPAIAALFGIGLVTMWQDYRRPGWRGWLLPFALIVTAAEQIYILKQLSHLEPGADPAHSRPVHHCCGSAHSRSHCPTYS